MSEVSLFGSCSRSVLHVLLLLLDVVEGYLTYKQTHPPRTTLGASARSYGRLFISEVPL